MPAINDHRFYAALESIAKSLAVIADAAAARESRAKVRAKAAEEAKAAKAVARRRGLPPPDAFTAAKAHVISILEEDDRAGLDAPLTPGVIDSILAAFPQLNVSDARLAISDLVYEGKIEHDPRNRIRRCAEPDNEGAPA